MNPKVDEFIAKAKIWQEELTLLRSYILTSNLTEDLKWYQPCYTYNDTNVLILSKFKQHCVISFLKGVLIKDEHNILVSPGANSQSVKFAKFTNVEQIKKQKSIIINYINQAIELEKIGAKVTLKKIDEYEVSQEFQEYLNKNKKLQTSFKTLTPGRQRQYLMHFAQPKQIATKISRIEKCIPIILSGKGLMD